jgi:glycosyltransferase involved in cell wall biosynthesis
MKEPNPHIICTVTNDLSYDQRMQRICRSLAEFGYKVTLVGREMPDSIPLTEEPFRQIRLPLHYQRGKAFYILFNLKLYKWLKNEVSNLTGTKVAICAIDLDTIIPCYYVSKQFGLPRVYDAHELFTELTEVKRRPLVAFIWQQIERRFVIKYNFGYTVNQFIKQELFRRYKVEYEVVRNMPHRLNTVNHVTENLPVTLPTAFLLYQGAVNEGRAFDELIPAMQKVNLPLIIVGKGNYFEKVSAMISKHGLEKKVIMTGYLTPSQLRIVTSKAFAGITLFNKSGLNQYYSLANRFFDYVQAGIPQLCNDYPEYAVLNKQYEVALMLDDLSPNSIEQSLNKLIQDAVLYKKLHQNATKAAQNWCWENESEKLLTFWKTLLPIEIVR